VEEETEGGFASPVSGRKGRREEGKESA